VTASPVAGTEREMARANRSSRGCEQLDVTMTVAKAPSHTASAIRLPAVTPWLA
jgi:hypothetical protein